MHFSLFSIPNTINGVVDILAWLSGRQCTLSTHVISDTLWHGVPAPAFCGCVWCYDTDLNSLISLECTFMVDGLESSSFLQVSFSAFKNLVSEKSDLTISFFLSPVIS